MTANRSVPIGRLCRVALMMAWSLLAACASSNDAPITCDALQKCEGDISVNQLTCPERLDDAACGSAYRAWLRCYTDSCRADAAADDDAGIQLCKAQLQAWYECRAMQRFDAAAE